MKYCGNDEEGTEAHSINPSCYLFPAVIREPVKEGTAHNGWNNEECMCVTVSSMFVTSRLVAAIGRGPVVHEPAETKTSREKSSERVKNGGKARQSLPGLF